MVKCSYLPLLIVLFGVSGVARAGGFYLELGVHQSREEAEAAAAQIGIETESLRIARRYVRGQGWRFVVRLEGLETKADAQDRARALTSKIPAVQIYEGQGYRRRLVEEIAGGNDAASLKAARTPTVDAVPPASQVLRMALVAHGGKKGGVQRVREAGSIRFAFDSRTFVDEEELRVRNAYVRMGEQARLEVDVLSGDGRSNVVVMAAPDKAWIATTDGVLPRDGVQTAEMLARFAPETGLLSIPLGFNEDFKGAAEWRGLESTGRVQFGGLTHVRVAPDRDGQGRDNPLEAALFRDDTRHLARVTWLTRGGRVSFEYSDYRQVHESVFIPHKVRVERDGKTVEEVEIKRFEIDPDLADGLFDEPVVLRGRR